MAKVKAIKGRVWCYGCERQWDVPNKHTYMQCPTCKSYRVYAVGTLAYHHALNEKEKEKKKNI